MSVRAVIAGGGTGGHVFPALAVAGELLARHPGSQVLFVGSRGGLEERLVPARGHPLALLRVGKLMGTGALGRGLTLAGLPLAVAASLRLLRRFGPDVVVGVGGYASGPVALAAAVLRLPLVLMEQNAIPGITNRLLARLACRVVIAFSQAAGHLPGRHAVLLGNPVRPELLAAFRGEGTGRRDAAAPPRLLVLGGSQGARALNELLTRAAPELARRVDGLRVLHQTGPADIHRVRRHYQEAGLVSWEALPFLEDMAGAYGAASLVLCRSGATTLAELAVAGLPALLVPYPFAARDHQAANAAELVRAGAALMVRQAELSADRLVELVCGLLGDPQRLARMGRAMAGCGRPMAGAEVADLLVRVARREEQR